MPPQRASAVAEDVRRNPVEPGQELALEDDDVFPAAIRLEEYDGREVFRLRPVGQAAEEVV